MVRDYQVGEGEELFFPAVGNRVSHVSHVPLLEAQDTNCAKESRVTLTGVIFFAYPDSTPLPSLGGLLCTALEGGCSYLSLPQTARGWVKSWAPGSANQGLLLETESVSSGSLSRNC